MATQTFTVPRTTMPIGNTVVTRATNHTTIHTLSVQSDITHWTLPGTLAMILESSDDSGTTWQGAGGMPARPTPSADDDGGPSTSCGFSETFGTGHTPTNLRLTVTVTGNPIPLGPTTITLT